MAIYPLKSAMPFAQYCYSKFRNLVHDNKTILQQDIDFFWMKNLARFEPVRNWATRDDGSAQAFLDHAQSNQVMTAEDFSTICQAFHTNGYYEGLQLTPDVLAALLKFAFTHPCYADRDPELKFDVNQKQDFEARLGRPIKLAGYMDDHESCAAFQRLKQDPLILAIAARYLGREPKYHRGEMAWSFPGFASDAEKLASAQVIHCDINDYKTVKFFFYLTEVDSSAGPHVYLRGSHKQRHPMHQLLGQRCASIPDETLVDAYGAENMRTVCGPAGFGFVGDPYVFHKGTTPTRHPRLLLQMEFGVNQYKTWYFASNSA